MGAEQGLDPLDQGPGSEDPPTPIGCWPGPPCRT